HRRLWNIGPAHGRNGRSWTGVPSPTDHPGSQAAVTRTLTATILAGAITESRRRKCARATGWPRSSGFTGLAYQVRLLLAGSGAAPTGPAGLSAIGLKAGALVGWEAMWLPAPSRTR